jgi:CheY-like chemotaxis protein
MKSALDQVALRALCRCALRHLYSSQGINGGRQLAASISATLRSHWNRPEVRPFEILIRYLHVEEPPVRILVVEDDPLVQEFVVEALREEGFHVIHAINEEEALAWCSRQVADVLVTDINLPGRLDGWQIAERFREHDPGLRVIYATGFSPVEARYRAV